MLTTAEQVRDVADQLSDSADAIKARRRRDFARERISSEDVKHSVLVEHELRITATELLVESNRYVITSAQFAQVDLQQAIAEAQATIDQIETFAHAMRVVASLVTLATAVVSRKPQAIGKAITGVRRELT